MLWWGWIEHTTARPVMCGSYCWSDLKLQTSASSGATRSSAQILAPTLLYTHIPGEKQPSLHRYNVFLRRQPKATVKRGQTHSLQTYAHILTGTQRTYQSQDPVEFRNRNDSLIHKSMITWGGQAVVTSLFPEKKKSPVQTVGHSVRREKAKVSLDR